jgi:hypothetical protein
VTDTQPPSNEGVADLIVQLGIARDEAERRLSWAVYLAHPEGWLTLVSCF